MEAAYSAKLFYILAQGNGAGAIWECSALVKREVLIRNKLAAIVFRVRRVELSGSSNYNNESDHDYTAQHL
jgi:hypothetical protein